MDALLRRRAMIAAGGSGPTPPTPPTPSPLPSGYTQLQYIEQPIGNYAYINTLIKTGNTVGFEIDAMSYDVIGGSDTAYGCFFGARYSSNNSDLQLSTFSSTSEFSGTLRRGTSSQNYSAQLPSSGTRFKASLVGDTYSIGQTTVSTIANITSSRTFNIYIFALHNGSSGAAQHGHFRLYSFKLTVGGDLVRNYVPCIDPNNVVGLYDLVSETFFSSENSTPFVAGPSINVQ